MMDCLPQVHVAAIHAEAGFNSVTPGIGILCRKNNWLIGSGAYHNSIHKTSTYGIVGWQPMTIGEFRLGVVVGAVSGYYSPISPMAAGAVSYKGTNLLVIPKVSEGTPTTFALSFDLKF